MLMHPAFGLTYLHFHNFIPILFPWAFCDTGTSFTHWQLKPLLVHHTISCACCHALMQLRSFRRETSSLLLQCRLAPCFEGPCVPYWISIVYINSSKLKMNKLIQFISLAMQSGAKYVRYGIPGSIYGKLLQLVFHFSSAICLGIANALQTPSLKLSVLQRPGYPLRISSAVSASPEHNWNYMKINGTYISHIIMKILISDDFWCSYILYIVFMCLNQSFEDFGGNFQPSELLS